MLGIAMAASACADNGGNNMQTLTATSERTTQIKQHTTSDIKPEAGNLQQQTPIEQTTYIDIRGNAEPSLNEVTDKVNEVIEKTNKTDTVKNDASESSKEKIKNTQYKTTICIDPGHQYAVDNSTEPVAPGASEMKVKNPGGATGISTGKPEYAVNLEVSKILKRILEENGYNVVMTRETNDVNIGNVERAEMANNINADLFIRIHADSVDSPGAHGISILIPGDMYIKDEAVLEKSERAANQVLDSVINETQAYSRGLSVRNDMTGFNWCKVPMLLIEMGFLSNPDEDNRLSNEQYQKDIANGIYKGIESYFKL